MTSADDAQSVARESMEAFNRGDLARLRDLCAPNAVEKELATGRTLNGPDEITAAAQGWRDAFPDAHGEIINSFGSGDQASVEVIWSGTHQGEMVGPGGNIPATGKRVNVPASIVLRVQNGKIVTYNHYFDLMTLLVQLGAVPAPQPA